MRRLIFRELEDQLCQVRLERQDSVCLESAIELDLIGRHRLHLDELFRGVTLKQFCDGLISFVSIARPVHVSAGTDHVLFKLQKVAIEMLQGVRFDVTCGLPERLPIWHFIDDSGALGTNGVGRISKIPPELRIPERDLGSFCELRCGCRPANANRHGVVLSSFAVEARISAM